MFADWYVSLHVNPAPFVAEPGERPEVSPLARAMIAMGETMIATRNHSLLRIDRPDIRGLMLAADGTKTVGELAELGHGIAPENVPNALKLIAKDGFLAS